MRTRPKDRRSPAFRSSRIASSLAATLVAGLGSCTHNVKVGPIKFEPIDITLHVYLEADEKLKSFFEDDAPASATPAKPTPSAEQKDGATP